MRVTQGMLTNQFLYNITNIYNRMQTQQNELSTGKSLNTPSDNPLAVSQDMSIRETLSQTSGYQNAISAGLSWMNNTTGAMQNIISTLQSIQSDLISGLNSTNQSKAGLAGLTNDVQQLVNGVYQSLDTKQGSRYLFGGTESAVPSSAVQAGTASSQPISYQVSEGVSIQVNVSAADIMLNAPVGSNDLKTTLNNILQHLQQGNTSAISQDLSDLGNNLNQAININADLGARTRRLTALQNQLSQYATTMNNEKGVIEGADMAKVITQFQTDQTVYTAALKMGAQILLPSLVSFLPNG